MLLSQGRRPAALPCHLNVSRQHAPVRREELSRSVFDREYSVFDRSIDSLVSGLRRKIGATGDGLERIKSIRNVGYMYADLDRIQS